MARRATPEKRSGLTKRVRGGIVAKPGLPDRPPLPPGDSARSYAEKLVASILARKRRIAGEFYAIGKELWELQRSGAFRVLGYRTLQELLVRRGVMAPVTALKLMTVAEAYPIELAQELGLEKGYALVRYVEATPAADVARELAAGKATIGGKLVAKMTVREISALTRRIRTGEREADPKDPAGGRARLGARGLQKKLRAVGAKQATARARWDGRRWEITIVMPAEQGAALEAVLGKL